MGVDRVFWKILGRYLEETWKVLHHREIIPNFKNQSALEMYNHFQGTFLL